MGEWPWPTGDQRQGWGRTKSCWVPGRCPHLGKAMALTHELRQVPGCPHTPGKKNLCSAVDRGSTPKRVSILAAVSCWPLYKIASVCQSWAAAARVAGGAAYRVGTPGAKSLQWHWGAPRTLAISGGHTRATSPGVPKDVREPAQTKGPGTAGGQVPLPRGTQPGPVCVSPPGHPAKALPP